MFSGMVVAGDQLGRQLGFPTANIAVEIESITLTDGVYAAYAYLHKKKYQAVLVIRRAVNKVEVHLFDYLGEDFYGEILAVEVVKKVGETIIFRSLAELKDKILNDVKIVQALFKDKTLT